MHYRKTFVLLGYPPCTQYTYLWFSDTIHTLDLLGHTVHNRHTFGLLGHPVHTFGLLGHPILTFGLGQPVPTFGL